MLTFNKLPFPTIFTLSWLVMLSCNLNNYNFDTTEIEEKFVVKTTSINSDKAEISGYVKDFKDQQPLRTIILLIKDNKEEYMLSTNHEGYFETKNIIPGKYSIAFKSTDYNYMKKTITLRAGKKANILVHLSMLEIHTEKPIIYLYPTQKQNIQVQLNYSGKITHSYPTYPKNGWQITAEPNGTLTDEKGLTYYALFWEGIPNNPLKATDGFIVAGSETAEFLEQKLAYLGLNRREANEFIMYWLPKMENNPYNLIHFAGDNYLNLAQLTITPKPETIIRIMMLTQPLQTKINFPLQDLTPLHQTRKGYTVVEWGGSVSTQLYLQP